MHPSKVSIIIPCYEQGHLLPYSIESALGQSYSNIETIVVNDGSGDNTDYVARSFGNRIRYLSKENEKRAAACNAGIKMATGKYLLFLNADDLLHAEAVTWLVEAIEEREDRMAVMGYRFFRVTPHEVEFSHLPPKKLTAFPLLIKHSWGPPHTFLCSRSMVIDLGGINEDVRVCGSEDWDLRIRLALTGLEISSVQRVGAFSRRHEGQSANSKLRILSSDVEVIEFLHRSILERPELLAQHGEDLLSMEYWQLRRCLANQLGEERARSLYRSIQELGQHGIRPLRSPARRLLDRILGHHSEALYLWLFRTLRPSQFKRYKVG